MYTVPVSYRGQTISKSGLITKWGNNMANGMADSDTDTTGTISINTVIAGAVGATVLYMIWIGVTGRPIPEWVYWISTVL